MTDVCECVPRIKITKCIMHIVDFYREEMMKKLIPALEPFKEYIKEPIQINITIGEI